MCNLLARGGGGGGGGEGTHLQLLMDIVWISSDPVLDLVNFSTVISCQ